MSILDKIRTGDRVRGSRVIYDTEVTQEGVVIKIDRFSAQRYVDKPERIEMMNVDIRLDNGHTDWIGVDERTQILSRAPEPQLPKNAVGWCHYCGQPAYGWGFFDEPACGQCGGK